MSKYNSLFDEIFGNSFFNTDKFLWARNIKTYGWKQEDDKSYTLTFEVPGCSPQDVEVFYDEGNLSIKANKNTFVLALLPELKVAGSAKVKNGLLTIRFEEEKKKSGTKILVEG